MPFSWPVRLADATPARPLRRLALALMLAAGTGAAHASFLSGEALDTAANWISWFVLIVVPFGLIAVFWIVHVMPEKIAEKRHHPQKAAIHTLCLLSLVFGGLLWPLAWLWAYTRPVGFKLAYGTERHEDFFTEHVGKAERGELDAVDQQHLREELDALAQRGLLTPALKQARARLARTPGAADSAGEPA